MNYSSQVNFPTTPSSCSCSFHAIFTYKMHLSSHYHVCQHMLLATGGLKSGHLKQFKPHAGFAVWPGGRARGVRWPDVTHLLSGFGP